MAGRDAGRYDREIVIEFLTTTQSSIGEPVETWTTFAPVWAQVLTKGGQEFFKSDQVAAEADKFFRIRYLPGLKRKMRILYEDEYYDIYDLAEGYERKKDHIIAAKVIRAQ